MGACSLSLALHLFPAELSGKQKKLSLAIIVHAVYYVQTCFCSDPICLSTGHAQVHRHTGRGELVGRGGTGVGNANSLGQSIGSIFKTSVNPVSPLPRLET